MARNTAVLRGVIDAEYFVDFTTRIPDEWIERPARAFNNLMQLPTLFYVVCLLSMMTETVDSTQQLLAWVFVAARIVHAAVSILFNHVKYRFACWMIGAITLIFLWTRFALPALPFERSFREAGCP